MENVNKNENAVVIEEQLENVSGGVDPSYILKVMCAICCKTVFKTEIVNLNNRGVCRDCAEKYGKGAQPHGNGASGSW